MAQSPRFTEEEIYLAACAAKRTEQVMKVELSEHGATIIIGTAAAASSPDAPQLKGILKIDDLAKHWNTSAGSVRRMIETGQIAAFRVGKLIRIRREEVERIDREGGTEGKQPVNEPVPYLPKTRPAPDRVLGRPDAFDLSRRSRKTGPKPE
jgi:excisionase family DNA binding protein